MRRKDLLVLCRVGCLGGKLKRNAAISERTKKALAFMSGGTIREGRLGGEEETPFVESL